MTTDSLKGFLEMASAVTGLSVDKARDVTKSLLTAALEAVDNPTAAVTHLSDVMRGASASSAAAVGDSVSIVAEGLSETIREEIDRAAARLGFVREEELAALRARVQRLEAQLSQSASSKPAPRKSSGSAPAKATPSGNATPSGKVSRSAGSNRAVKRSA